MSKISSHTHTHTHTLYTGWLAGRQEVRQTDMTQCEGKLMDMKAIPYISSSELGYFKSTIIF
jgi:hypothetical protein